MPEPVTEPTERAAEREPLYRDVLVPTDRSVGARRGIDYGLDIARNYGATVHLLHVVDDGGQRRTSAPRGGELAIEQLEEGTARLLREYAGMADEMGVGAVTSGRRGSPTVEIVRYAEDNDIDLIVMGIHGEDRGSRPHVGSTTGRVLRFASVPVLPV